MSHPHGRGVLGSYLNSTGARAVSFQSGEPFSWRAFQLEIALEEAFHGNPLSNLDIVYSSALGTSSHHDFSATHIRGFMALGPATGAAIDNTPPPLSHWTKDNLQVLQVQRLFSLTCNMECKPSVLDPSLVLLLLQNIFRRNEKIPLTELQATKCPETLKGHIIIS